MKYALIYLAVISLIAITVTVADKSKARRNKWRVPEAALLGISALGGSVAMFVTMLLIRHKTKHVKFMLGIPLIIALQIAAVVVIIIKFPDILG